MTQRQLAERAGVSHSTISRLLRGDRAPSLGTATKLARALRELQDPSEAARYFGLAATSDPATAIEVSLRSDGVLAEEDILQIMRYYGKVRRGCVATSRIRQNRRIAG